MAQPRFIAATLSVLDQDDHAHSEGLRQHLHDVWSAGIDGVLIGGTMGMMQMLTDGAYRDMVRTSVEVSRGRGEVLVGVGDTSLARTLERVDFANGLAIDGVVVLTPYFFPFDEAALVGYYHAVADAAKAPVFLYDLPVLTKTALSVPTVVKAMQHPNIAGIKCSGPVDDIVILRTALPDHCRVIVAHPTVVHGLTQGGYLEHLDGIFAVAPHWTAALGNAIAHADDSQAITLQRRLTALLRIVRRYGPLPASSVIMNARGIAGRAFCAPMQPLHDDARAALLAEPLVQQLVREYPCGALTT